MSNAGEDGVDRCDFCRLPCPEGSVTMAVDGTTYGFCSESCRAAMEDSDKVFTEYRGYRRFDPGVSALDAALPQGQLRNSLVLLSGQAGTRMESISAELVWRALQRDDPAVYVTFQEPPVAVVEEFLEMDWNVLPYLERGQLHILDAFTYRVDDSERMRDRMNDWNKYLVRVLDPATVRVRDGTDTAELRNKLDACLRALDRDDAGLVLIDSLTELGTLVQPVQAYDFVKDVRADVCKGRFVPVFAGATFSGDASEFPHDLDYTADGVVELELNNDIVKDALLKRARVRKMNGVLSYTDWRAYEYTSRLGMVTFDPEAQVEEASDTETTDETTTESETGDGGSTEPEPETETETETGTGTRSDSGSGSGTAGSTSEPAAEPEPESESGSDGE